MNESNDDSMSRHLFEFCESDSLSEEGLREIIEHHELMPNNDNQVGDYNIFIAACDNERITKEIIQFLLEYFPAAAGADNDDGLSPLHAACGNPNMTIGIIQILIDAAPDSVRSVSNTGRMPLHCLCSDRKVDEAAAIQILKLLLEKCPEAVRQVDIKEDRLRLPIHIASLERSLDFCRVLLEAYPGSEQITDANGALPLHYACIWNTVATVEYFHKLYPDAIHHANPNGLYPIHIAIRSINHRDNPSVAVDIVKFLLDCHPDVKLQKYGGGSSEGSLLHWVCLQKCNDSKIDCALEIFQIIYDAYPESIRMEDSNGWLPLHDHCRIVNQDERSALKMLKVIIEKHPEAVRHADNYGNLPIHIASWWRSPVFCGLLIEGYPGSERISDANGALPLHLACAGNTVPTVEYLYRRYPDAINHAITDAAYPIHLAIRGILRREDPIAAVEVVRFLLDCDPNVKLQKVEGRSLLHFACKRNYNESNIEAGMQMIKIIFDAHPKAIENNRIVSNLRHYHHQVQAFINDELVYARQAKDLPLMTTPDVNGQLPLHRALQNNVRLGSIKLLVKGNPHAVQSSDNKGALPLHVACMHHVSAKVIDFIVGQDTSTLDSVDQDGNTALHLACLGARHDIIALLLDEFDAVSVSKRNADKKLPIDLLFESNAVGDRESSECTESVYRLLKAHPETIMGIGTQIESVPASFPCPSGKKRKLGH